MHPLGAVSEVIIMSKKRTLSVAFMGIFAAIVVVTAFIPLKTLGLEITFTMVPIAVAAITFGPAAGASLGAVFGVVSFLQCVTGYSAFGAMLLSINPFLTAIVSIPTRILAGWISGMLFKLLNRGGAWNGIAYTSASLAAPLFNTALFMSTLVLCFYNTEYVQGFVSVLGATNPFTFIILFVGINGLVELACGFAIALPASVAVKRAIRRTCA